MLSALDPGSPKPDSKSLPAIQSEQSSNGSAPEKGFGFVELSDEFGDGFLHGSVLARTGISAVQPGDTLEVRVGPGHKGPHVTEVLSVHSSIAARVAPRRSSATPDSPPPATGIEETGTVKWFNAEGLRLHRA